MCYIYFIVCHARDFQFYMAHDILTFYRSTCEIDPAGDFFLTCYKNIYIFILFRENRSWDVILALEFKELQRVIISSVVASCNSGLELMKL